MRYLFCFITLIIGLTATAQTDSIYIAPYKRYPTLPPIQLLLGDSSTKFTKDQLPKKPVMVFLFNPDCDHCQHETEELVMSKELFRDVQVVMATTAPLWRMNEFVKKYRVMEIPNVVVGKDFYYLLPPFYDMRNFPFHGMYNKEGNLIEAFEGSLSIPKLLELLKR